MFSDGSDTKRRKKLTNFHRNKLYNINVETGISFIISFTKHLKMLTDTILLSLLRPERDDLLVLPPAAPAVYPDEPAPRIPDATATAAAVAGVEVVVPLAPVAVDPDVVAPRLRVGLAADAGVEVVAAAVAAGALAAAFHSLEKKSDGMSY